MNKALNDAKIQVLVEKGRKEITTKKQLEKFPVGSLISYINIDNELRTGGFITKFKNDYFIYIAPDFKKKRKGKYERILKMWVGSVYKTKNDIVSITKTDKDKTNFPVKVNHVVVYYARSTIDQKRFQNTAKYKTMILWTEYFL
jgi:hypothetical protein